MTLRKSNFIFLVSVLTLGLSSCLKEEIPVAPRQPGDLETNEIEMGEDYRNQLYFDLGSNQVVRSNLKTEWDLGFESTAENHITLNTGKGMAVHRSNLNFSDITNAEDLEWYWDTQTGNLDSTAFGAWEIGKVYVVDRGYDWLGEHQGYSKIEVIAVSESDYIFMYGDIEASSGTHFTLEKSITERFSYFSFDDGQLTTAPPDTDYDLIFTQYIHLFTDPLTPYLVTGILSNRDLTGVARLDEVPFENITLEDAETLEFSYDLNAIGYNWKSYDLEEGVFTTYSDQHYIIKTQDGLFYKLRIVGFYNAEGLKGYPNIEFQAL